MPVMRRQTELLLNSLQVCTTIQAERGRYNRNPNNGPPVLKAESITESWAKETYKLSISVYGR